MMSFNRFVTVLMLLTASLFCQAGVVDVEKKDIDNVVTDNGSAQLESFIKAVKMMDSALVTQYIAAGIDVNSKGSSPYPAVFYASAKNYDDILQQLLDAGSDVNQSGRGGWTPLMVASLHGHQDIVAALLEAKAEQELKSADGMTALMYAVAEKNQTAAALLIEAGANPNAIIGDEKSANKSVLSLAVEGGDTAIIDTLINMGAKVDGGKDRYQPLYYALQKNNILMTDRLVEAGASLQWQDREGNNYLHLNAAKADRQTVQYLIEHRVNYGAVNRAGKLPLDIAAERGNVENMSVLIKVSDKLDRVGAYFNSVTAGVQSSTAILLESGIKINSRDRQGRTGLMIAAEYRHHHLVDFLLAQGVDVKYRDKQGRTALMYGVTANPSKIRIVNSLLAAGSDSEQEDNKGHSALMMAVMAADSVDPAVVELLIANGASSTMAAERISQQITVAEQENNSTRLQKLALLAEIIDQPVVATAQ
ncbi:hypothetical protein SIN8267_02034 [Sinobacterium norvegicum]|uniref:Uncharacterized protein n=1 Tax=Sinobacterium norvegicum TaxID=1641715 RepID=A0ABM9AFD0_9GAMM|nr:ankyrin repeat domain-containing protein [Sinobacterium norvegicum]CAH0991919.1 hypothetical protein SIN8267_02034 [Sinobacterium norvegicum]